MSPAVSGGGYHHAQRGGKLAASKGEGFDANGALFTGKQKSDGEGKKESGIPWEIITKKTSQHAVQVGRVFFF